ncbi:tetratricopeptide repeat protein [Leptospira ognonensis]|uniref:Tetratricopeptide repeat protein n=1 Tax=Leptospira ognonensis TaxID=2484945 RepID=A0A4R9K9N9_9LEPT|nr:tetratricopeptide repeat protein [Leptospira ognonensis]TGL62160.1 tetratricopeptide repeat protein [Leptospira ognonensis]
MLAFYPFIRILRLAFLLSLSVPFALTLEASDQVPNATEIFLPFPVEPATTDTKSETDLLRENQDRDPNSPLSEPSNLKKSDISAPNDGKSEKSNGTLGKNSEASANTVSANTDSPKPKKKKKGKGEVVDPTEPPLKRGKALLTRNKKQSAETEFADSYSKEGTLANVSRTENANLFGLDAKDMEGSGLVEKIEDPDAKIKAQFELARSLDRMGNSESEEKAYKEYLKLVTGFPVHPEITPRTHLAIAVLLFRRQEYRPALHHLVRLMKEFKTAKEFTTAHYYAGRIYESAWPDRDLERAKKYYDNYLKVTEGREETPGNDFKKDAGERRRLIESPLGI